MLAASLKEKTNYQECVQTVMSASYLPSTYIRHITGAVNTVFVILLSVEKGRCCSECVHRHMHTRPLNTTPGHTHTHTWTRTLALPISPSLSTRAPCKVSVSPCNYQSKGRVSFQTSTLYTALKRKQASDSFRVSKRQRESHQTSNIHRLANV